MHGPCGPIRPARSSGRSMVERGPWRRYEPDWSGPAGPSPRDEPDWSGPAGPSRRRPSATMRAMPVPDRAAAASVLLSLRPAPWFIRHSRAVAEVASWLASRAARAGVPVDRQAVEAAALLHDVDKALSGEDPVRRLRHGEASAAWLTAHGLPELAPLVEWHPVTRLADGPAAERWLATGLFESLIVAYADK